MPSSPSATSSATGFEAIEIESMAAVSRKSIFDGMVCIDTSRNERIPLLMQLVGAISRAKSPQEVIQIYGRGMRDLRPQNRGYVSLSTRGLRPGQYRITRFIANMTRLEAGQVDSWSRPDMFEIREGGFLGQLIRSAYPELIHNLQVPNDPVIGTALAPFGSLLAIPLFDDGEPLNWAISLDEDPHGFSVKELEDTILQGNLVGGTVKRVLMAQQLNEANQRAAAEVRKIADIQRALLPSKLPAIPGVRLGASYETFDQAGGDSYDFLDLDRLGEGARCGAGAWGILIADASGHGPAAAVVMAMLHAILHAYPKSPCGPAELLAHANRHMHDKQIEHSFVTALLAFYHPQRRTLTYARAGHPPPVHMTRDGESWKMSRVQQVGGLPLGIMDDVTYEEHTIQLEPGQTMVFYTDGITEAMAPDGRMFGVSGIEHSLTECSGEPDCVIGHIKAALADHQAGACPNDDQTVVVMKVQ